MNNQYKLCPKCSTEAQEESLICRKCLYNLRSEPLLSKDINDNNQIFVDSNTRLENQTSYLKRRLISIVLISIYAIIFIFGNIIYIQKYRLLPALPVGSSQTQINNTNLAWPTEYGGTLGVRNTTQNFTIPSKITWAHTLDLPALYDMKGLSTNLIGNEKYIFYGLVNGQIQVISTETGALVWSKKISGLLDSTPIIIDNRLFFAQRDGTISSIELSTGRVLWENNAEEVFLTGIYIVDGMLYANSLYSIFVIDIQNGETLWSKKLGKNSFLESIMSKIFGSSNSPVKSLGEYPATAVSAKGEMLILGTTSAVKNIDRQTGELRHIHRTSWLEHTYIENDTFFTFSKNEIASININARGRWWDKVPVLRWSWGQLTIWGMAPPIPRDENNWILSAGKGNLRSNIIHLKMPAINNQTIFSVHYDGTIKAIDKETGILNWEKYYNTEVTDPIITKSGLVIGIDGDLVLIDVSSGNEKEKMAIKNGPINQMTIIGDSLFAVINDERIIRLD